MLKITVCMFMLHVAKILVQQDPDWDYKIDKGTLRKKEINLHLKKKW